MIASEAWLIGIRWWAGLGVLAATWLTTALLRLSLPAAPLYAIGAAILVYNVALRAILKRRLQSVPHVVGHFEALANAQIGLDWLAMALLIHFSGGIESPAILYLFFHIIIASTLLSPRSTYVYAAVATLLVGGMSAFEYVGLVPHHGVGGFVDAPLYQNPVYIGGVLLFFVSAIFVAAFMASTLNSRLRKREQEIVELGDRLQRAYGRLQTLYEGMQAVNSTLDLQQVLDRLARGTAEAMGVRGCSIRLLDETGARLTMAAAYGLSDGYVRKGDLMLERNPLAREVLLGKAISVGDVTREDRLQFGSQAAEEGIRSTLSARLQGKRGTLGMIRAYSTEFNHFTQDDITFLTAIANQGSLAIENAMAFQTLGQLDEMKSKFVLIITHELRSPVSVVRSLLRTITNGYAGTLSDQQMEIVARALQRADFLQTLIDDLLDLASGKSAPLGLIRAYSTEVDHFTEDDATFLSAIANQGSLAIENAMAYQTLGRLDEMKSKFVLMVTHELRSPVSVVRSLLRTITGGYAGALSDQQTEIISRALQRADYLQTLIDDLLDLAAGKSEISQKERSPVSLADAVERIIKRFQVPAQEKNIRLEWRCESAGRSAMVLATAEDIDRVLNNLVSNAVKYTPSDGKVTVTLRRAGGYAHLKVIDTGIGIPDESQSHLFEEFYRAPNAKAQVKEGTGLGLAITRDLVTRYGGRIGVESQVGEGTTFAVILPVTQESSA